MKYSKILAENLERERVSRNLSQAEWASALGISISAYKRLITGETAKIDIDMIARLYFLTGKLLFEFYGESSEHLDLVRKLRDLTPEQLRFIELLVDRERSRNVVKKDKDR